MAVKVISLAFGKPPFRKLGNFEIQFADRLILIPNKIVNNMISQTDGDD